MAPGARIKFGVPMFETEAFLKQIYYIDKSMKVGSSLTTRQSGEKGIHTGL